MEMRRPCTGGTQCMAWSPPNPFSTRQEPAGSTIRRLAAHPAQAGQRRLVGRSGRQPPHGAAAGAAGELNRGRSGICPRRQASLRAAGARQRGARGGAGGAPVGSGMRAGEQPSRASKRPGPAGTSFCANMMLCSLSRLSVQKGRMKSAAAGAGEAAAAVNIGESPRGTRAARAAFSPLHAAEGCRDGVAAARAHRGGRRAAGCSRPAEQEGAECVAVSAHARVCVCVS
jgi:hypothetical protein